MGKYITQQAVIVRLRSKVKFTDNPEENPDKMSVELLNRLILEGESQVEMDLSTRYEAPFQTIHCHPFARLPDTTQNIVRTLCELTSVIRVLETDFGRGSSVDASKYSDSQQKRYDRLVFGDDKVPGLITLRADSFNIFRLPPLPSLKSNFHVAAVDTGFSGYVGKSDQLHHHQHPELQINDPSESFYNGFINGPRDWEL